MRIETIKPLNDEGVRRVPSDEQVLERASRIENLFHNKRGYNKTELTALVIPIIARAGFGVRHDKTSFDPSPKGMAMIGNMGTGKTMLLQLAANYLDIEYFDVPSLSIEFGRYGADGFWGKVDPSRPIFDLIIDDLGAEQDSKSYGNAVPIIDLLYNRYNLWQRTGARLWLSSNLTRKELETRYGTRVVDRIREMCEVVTSVGKSLR